MTTTVNALPATQVARVRWPWIMLFSRTLLFLGLMPYLVATHMLMDFAVMLFVPAASL